VRGGGGHFGSKSLVNEEACSEPTVHASGFPVLCGGLPPGA
jgi:hypothetical protein